MTPKTIIFMGPQGSGKGTQVALLQAVLVEAGQTVCDIQTGRIFRDLAAGGSFAGERVSELITKGCLVPDTLTNALWITDLKNRLTPEAHLLIDGFPRTLAQAEVVDEVLAFFVRSAVEIINLDTPEAVVVERMVARGRADDTPESIKRRLALYHEETLPVLEHYRKATGVIVHDINGAGTLEEVQSAINRALGT